MFSWKSARKSPSDVKSTYVASLSSIFLFLFQLFKNVCPFHTNRALSTPIKHRNRNLRRHYTVMKAQRNRSGIYPSLKTLLPRWKARQRDANRWIKLASKSRGENTRRKHSRNITCSLSSGYRIKWSHGCAFKIPSRRGLVNLVRAAKRSPWFRSWQP